MKKAKIIAAVAIVLSAAVLMGCSPRNAMSTLSTESDSETAEVFSLTKVLDLGTNYLVSLDYENAILQYIDIIQHDPKNKEAYAGLYAAYAAQGKTDEASEVLNKAQEVFENDAEFLPEFLKDANLVYENGGGNSPFQFLSNQYWDDTNSIFAKDVSDAWLEAEPDTGDAASVANSMAQEALRKGLGSSETQAASSSSSIAAPAYDPAQDDGTDEEFDWSEIESEFPAFSDDLAS